MKEAAANQMEMVTDATSSLGKGLKKSLKSYSKEAGRFARTISELIDCEDLMKSLHKVAHPGNNFEKQNLSFQNMPFMRPKS